MSEQEILRRQEYKRNRKKWMIIQILALVVVASVALGCFVVYNNMNRTYYIEYTETGGVDYQVKYADNTFFDSEWIDKDGAYITSLVNGVNADFNYKLNMDASNIGFDYKYTIDAQLLVADTKSGAPYYTVTENVLPEKKVSTVKSDNVEIAESVSIDFNKFNEIASSFIKTYNLQKASGSLIVSLNVEVLSSCPQFEQKNENNYSVSLIIPLAEDTFSMTTTTSVPETENKVLACKGAVNQNVVLVFGILFGIIAVVIAAGLVVFLHITRNEDITYSVRVRKLLSAYRSFIQPIENDFDDTGYQTVIVKSFTDLLSIRDTIQSPVLMSENRDETMTRFLIPTDNKILYAFEIKVDNYDEIYYGTKKEEPSDICI